MARPLRIEFDGAWYHVMNRGLEKRIIFRDDFDRQVFLDLLGNISDTFGVQIHAYSLMPNHYHLLMHTPKTGQLSRAMRHLNGLYTQKFNKKWHRDGPLFRGRYKAVIADETYLPELAEYIHLNPVKAKITTVSHKHPWTSGRAYRYPKHQPRWLITNVLQKQMRPSQTVSATEEKKFDFDKPSLGRKGFHEWICQNHLSQKKKDDREISKQKKNPFSRPNANQILEMVSLAFDKSIPQIRRSTKSLRLDRSVAIYLMRQLAGLPQKQIAKWIDAPSAYAVAKNQQRLQTKLTQDKKLKNTVEQIKRSILSHVKT